ncbi:MAG TPA: monovalent cation/H(+) antiporter subunit G [Candidatus Tectomicrobia bacterium]|nr:monovalent cation/H(+) antiporter subunit G [Candidatus Tectomicrobia bacterium]
MSGPPLALVDALVVLSLAILTIGVGGSVLRRPFSVRLHAAGKAVFLGILPLLIAAVITGGGAAAGRAGLVILFLLLTTPVGAHAIARAAEHDPALREPGGWPDA